MYQERQTSAEDILQIECHNDLTVAQAAEWRAFQAMAVHQHPRQDPRFADVERALGKTPLYVMGRRAGRLCAVALFSLQPSKIIPGRFAAATALSGPVCDDEATMVAFLCAVAAARALTKVDAIKITPYWLDGEGRALASALTSAGWVRSDPTPVRETGLIDLSRSEEELRSSFSRSARRKLRLVEKSAIEIRPIEDAAAALVFYERLNKLVLKRHHLTLVTGAEQKAMFANVLSDPQLGRLFAAYHDAVFLGGLLIYRSRYTAHARRYVADAAAADTIDNLRVAPSLWLEGMLWAKQQGCVDFDVEGYRLVENKDDPMFNVFEYKRELNPRVATRVAEHTLALNKILNYANALPQNVKRAVKTRFPSLALRLKKLKS